MNIVVATTLRSDMAVTPTIYTLPRPAKLDHSRSALYVPKYAHSAVFPPSVPAQFGLRLNFRGAVLVPIFNTTRPGRRAGFFIGRISVVEFNQETRKFCRYPKCRSKLPAPVSNAREAFCTRGCHKQFYRSRCFVCEGPMERKTERQLICGKRKCRNGLQGRSLPLGRYGTGDVISPLKKPVNKGPKQALKPDRPRSWRSFRGGIVGPTRVIEAEVIARRVWREVVSPDGVGCYVTSLRQQEAIDQPEEYRSYQYRGCDVPRRTAAHTVPVN